MSMIGAKRRKSAALKVSRRRSPCSIIVATTLVSAIAVAMVKAGALAWGRVTAPRYSRSTWGLTHRVDPSPSARAADATACCGPMTGWHTPGHSCPRRPGHRPLLPYISWRLSETLPSHGVSWDGKSARRGRFSTRCGRGTVIVTSCSPGGTSAGAMPEMRWSGPTRIRVRMSVMAHPEKLTDTMLRVVYGRGNPPVPVVVLEK
jgi:hypothetical protein